jgi:hypothetical protein
VSYSSKTPRRQGGDWKLDEQNAIVMKFDGINSGSAEEHYQYVNNVPENL